MLTLMNIILLAGFAFQNCAAAETCQNANWWASFDLPGWSDCPGAFPYMKGLKRSKSTMPSNDFLYHLEEARCCNNGNSRLQCVPADWTASFDSTNWNLCPSGYYLSGLNRSTGNNLNNIEHAWCCKPRGAPNSYKSCYTENVRSIFDWSQNGIAACTKPRHYITGIYRSSCNLLRCIELLKCCEL